MRLWDTPRCASIRCGSEYEASLSCLTDVIDCSIWKKWKVQSPGLALEAPQSPMPIAMESNWDDVDEDSLSSYCSTHHQHAHHFTFRQLMFSRHSATSSRRVSLAQLQTRGAMMALSVLDDDHIQYMTPPKPRSSRL